MKPIRFLTAVLVVAFFLSVGSLPARADLYYSYIRVQESTWRIEPTTHNYHFAIVAKWKTFTYGWDIDAVYDVEAFTFKLDITRSKTDVGPPDIRSGQVLVQHIMSDPFIYRFLPLNKCNHQITGDLGLLPKGSGNEGNACKTANFLTFEQHQALKSEYMSLISGHPTLAPFPTAPKENDTAHDYRTIWFAALLPFQVYTPCQHWNFSWLIERHAPNQGGGYEWEHALTHEEVGYRNEETGQCSVGTLLQLNPGKHRYKLRARCKDGRTSPWSLPFEFKVAKKTIRVADPAKVMEALDPWIHITKPAEGERWKRGEQNYIRWKSLKVPGKVLIFLVTDSGYTHRIGPYSGVDASLGYWRWMPGEDIPFRDDYRILVRHPVNHLIKDQTPYTFAIVPVLHVGNQGKKLTLEEPHGGETWKTGTPYDIRWSRKNIKQTARVEVALLKGGQFFKRISPVAGLLVHSGKTSWTPGSDIPWSSNYQVRISLKNALDVKAESGNFTIKKMLGTEMGGTSYGPSRGSSAAQQPVFRAKLNGRSFILPTNVSPSVKFVPGNGFAHFEVQQSTGPGNWSRPMIFKTTTFSITKAGSYRYRAVGKRGGKSQWDTFKVRAKRPGATRVLIK